MADFNKQAALNGFTTHLRFLGYDVKVDDEVVIANHPNKADILLFVYSNGTMLKSLFRANPDNALARPGYLELINSLNRQSLVTRYYADNDGDLMFEAFFSSGYSQTEFARFLDLWDTDFQSMIDTENLESFLA
jgi:hypothetical protein